MPVASLPSLTSVQIARHGRIVDFEAPNQLCLEVREEASLDWAFYKAKYEPIKGALLKEFRSLTQKGADTEFRLKARWIPDVINTWESIPAELVPPPPL